MTLLITNLQLSQAVAAQQTAGQALRPLHWDWLSDLMAIRMREADQVWLDHPLVTINQSWLVNQLLQRRPMLEFRLDANTFIQQAAQFARNPENQSRLKVIRDHQGRLRESIEEAGTKSLIEIEGLWAATSRPGLNPSERMALIDLALRWGKQLPWVQMPEELLEQLCARCHNLSADLFGGSEWLEYWVELNSKADKLPAILASDPQSPATLVGLARVLSRSAANAVQPRTGSGTSQEVATESADIARLLEYNEILVNQYHWLSEERDRLERLLIDLQGSLSWRATEPLRLAMRIFAGGSDASSTGRR